MSTAAASMRVTMLLLATAVASLVTCASSVLAQPTSALSGPAEEDLSDQYIVVLKEGVGQASERVASDQARRLGLEVRHTYQYALKGYAARIPPG
jgi:hypothetical protein